MSPLAEEYMRILMAHYDDVRLATSPTDAARRLAELTLELTDADCTAINVCHRASQIAAMRAKRPCID